MVATEMRSIIGEDFKVAIEMQSIIGEDFTVAMEMRFIIGEVFTVAMEMDLEPKGHMGSVKKINRMQQVTG